MIWIWRRNAYSNHQIILGARSFLMTIIINAIEMKSHADHGEITEEKNVESKDDNETLLRGGCFAYTHSYTRDTRWCVRASTCLRKIINDRWTSWRLLLLSTTAFAGSGPSLGSIENCTSHCARRKHHRNLFFFFSFNNTLSCRAQ